MTFYLKYRPQTIEELDLVRVRERLLVAVKHGTFSHAYLFTGPKGTGKTSAARILAREAGATDIDIIELDAASNRGIDDIRALREKVGLSPAMGAKKAYIIDEVHMLTAEAFNALLKTLEEPPPHVLFFLCTTEIEKVPKTIASRCVSIAFNRATTPEIVRALSRSAIGEKLTVANDVLGTIALWSDGSFREAQTILEQASQGSSKKTVTGQDVERVVGGSLAREVEQYVAGVISGNATGALTAIQAVSSRGGDVLVFAKLVLDELRGRLLSNAESRLLDVVRIVEERTRTVKYSLIPQLPLEIAALELSSENPTPDASLGQPPAPDTAGVSDSVPKAEKTAVATAISLEDLMEKWPLILDAVKKKNHGILTLLVHCVPRETKGRIIVVDAKYQFHLEQLGQEKFRTIVESAMKEIFGISVGVQFRLQPHTEVVLKEFSADDNIRGVEEDDVASLATEIFST